MRYVSPQKPVKIGLFPCVLLGQFGGVVPNPIVDASNDTVDGRNPAPPKKPWNGLIPCTNQQTVVSPWFLRWRRVSSMHGSVSCQNLLAPCCDSPASWEALSWAHLEGPWSYENPCKHLRKAATNARPCKQQTHHR